MRKLLFLLAFIVCQSVMAADTQLPPDTVSVGIYITSVHDIDFREKQYSINLWLWLKYKNPDFDFSKYLEVPMAKSFEKSYYMVDTIEDGRIYMLMKLQCVMKDAWKIQNFPFDHQRLQFTIENSQYDSDKLVFTEDTAGQHYSKWTTSGWTIVPDSFMVSVGLKKYETAFGDPTFVEPHSEFSNFKVQILLERESWGLFFKLFIGMYISFLLSYVCFFIHNQNIESRFSLSVGSLFAVIGNKYIVDSSLPESNSFTLVDTLHGLTLFFIFVIVACSVYALQLVKAEKVEKAISFDKRASLLLLVVYLILNAYFILEATMN